MTIVDFPAEVMTVELVKEGFMTDLLDTNQRSLIENLCIDRLVTDFPAMTGAELGKGLETGDRTAEKEVRTEETGDHIAEKGACTGETGDHTAEKGARTGETGDRTAEIRDQQAEIGGLITERHKIAQRH